MPEGPSLIILKEELQIFKGKKVIAVEGNSKENIKQLESQRISDIKSWGKQFLICFDNTVLKIHFLLYGRYLINERKDKPSRLSLQFDDGEVNFYNCSIKFITQPLDEIYDWSCDVMSDCWDEKSAKKKLRAASNTLVCDALLDQNIFSGVGNIIKNEVLHRIKVHPETVVGALPPKKLAELVREARNYSFDFLKWKKEYVLRKHWLAHTKKTCTRDGAPIVKKYLGTTNRRTFYCLACQKKYE
jgi:endonuclease-8